MTVNARDGLRNIRREHVEDAFRELELEGVAATAGSYFVRMNAREVPAKRLLRAAYKLANAKDIPASAFSGGTFTAEILRALGFEVVVRGARP